MTGRIAARGLVLRDEAGEPSLTGERQIVEYNLVGRVQRRLGPLGERDIVAGSEWNAYVAQWEASRVAAEARLGGPGTTLALAADEYPAGVQCRGASGDLVDPPPVPPFFRWILVPAAAVGPVPCPEFILALSPLPSPASGVTAASLIVDRSTFEILERAPEGHVFAFESAFFEPPDDAPGWCQPDFYPDDAEFISLEPNGQAFSDCPPGFHGFIWSPIVGARVDTITYNRAGSDVVDTSSASGGFNLPIVLPQVPTSVAINTLAYFLGGPTYLVTWGDPDFLYVSAWARMRWDNFNPRSPGSRYYFLARRHARQRLLSGGSDGTVGDYWYANFAIDAVMMRARVRMANLPFTEELVPLVDADYEHTEFTQYSYVPPSSPGARASQGLVNQISAPDLRDTDVFVFRAADGQLIGARWGMSSFEVAGSLPDDPGGITIEPGCEENACLDFNVMMRGPASRGTLGGTQHVGAFEPYSSSRGSSRTEIDYLTPIAPFIRYLRPGDTVQIVVINRVTGYIGTQSASVSREGSASGQLLIGGVDGVEITMRPPNLRVTARRVYDVQAGSSYGESRGVTLGSEGAGLNSDTMIEIATEWVDDVGTPLPSSLPGYTGRLSRVIDGGVLEGVGEGSGDDVGQFEIRPGLHTQVIHLPQEGSERAHYYVHVDAAAPQEVVDFMGRTGRVSPDFDPNRVCYHDGDGGWVCLDHHGGPGPLESRPAVFVPFQVQVFDESATLAAVEAQTRLLREAHAAGEDAPVLEGLRPVYSWVYSPEFQFSIFDLDVHSVDLLGLGDGDGRPSSTSLTIDYDADDGSVSALDSMSGLPADELLFGIGYTSVVALIDEDGSVDTRTIAGFPDVEELVGLSPEEQIAALDHTVGAMEPDDFLTLQIYTAGDRGHALWEMDGALLLVSDAHPISLERRWTTATFDGGVGAGADHFDSFDIVRFRLFEQSNVTVRILDRTGAVVAEHLQHVLAPGLHHFLLDAGGVLEAGVDPESDPYFQVEIEARAVGGALSGPEWTHRIRHIGHVGQTYDQVTTGQVMMGAEVMLQDGSVRLSRVDFTLPGVGPELSFTRTYTNLSFDGDRSTLGVGWTHNWDFSLRVLSRDDVTSGSPIPEWVDDLKDHFFRWSEVPTEVSDPTTVETQWTAVFVNGTEFRWDGSRYVAERGRHGSLSMGGGNFTYRAEDGTEYVYPVPPAGGSVPVTYQTDPSDPLSDLSGRRIRVRDGLAYRVGLDPELLSLPETVVPGGPGTGSEYRTFVRPGPPPSTNCSAIRDRFGNEVALSYSAEGLLESVSGSGGRAITFSYEARPVTGIGPNTRLTRVEGPGGLELAFGYNSDGYLDTATRATRTETYGYEREEGITDGSFNLVSYTEYPSASSPLLTEYTYYGPGEIPASVLAQEPGLRVRDMIRTLARPHAAGEGDGEGVPTTHYFYETVGSEIVRRVVDARGEESRYFLNAAGNPTRVEEPLGRETQFTWSGDVAGEDNVLIARTETVSSGHSRTTTYEYDYDAFGRLLERRELGPLAGAVITTVFEPALALPVLRIDRNGTREEWSYDAVGRLLTSTDGEGGETVFTTGTDGMVRSIRMPGHAGSTQVTYDTRGNLDTVTDPVGGVTDYDYDVRGRLRRIEDPLGHVTEYFVDELDNVTMIRHPALSASPLTAEHNHIQREETFVYDALGRVLSATDRNGETTTYTYTARGQVKTATRAPDGGSRSFRYDAGGHLVSETDWLGNEASHTYDELGRRIATTDRLGETMHRGYDLAGRLVRIEDYEGVVTTLGYDDLDRLTLRDTAGGRRLAMTYFAEVDPDTNLRSITETRTPLPPSTVQFAYNGRYQLASRTNPLGRVYSMEYRADGQLTAVVDEDGHRREYEWDEAARMTLQRDFLGPRAVVTSYGYDLAGRRTSVTEPGREVAHSYDEWNRLVATSIVDDAESGIGSTTYTSHRLHDGLGNVVMTRDARGDERSTLRDRLGRVTVEIDGEGERTTTSYDHNGNPLTVARPRATTEYDYDAEDRIEAVREAVGTSVARTTVVLARDAMGNVVRVRDPLLRVTEVDYDANYLPIAMRPPMGPAETRSYSRSGLLLSITDRRGATTSFEYDLASRRTGVVDALTHRTAIAYDQTGHVVVSTDPRDIETELVRDDMYRVTEVRRAGARQLTREYDDRGNLIAEVDARGNRTEYEVGSRDLVRTIRLPAVAGETEAPTITQRYDGAGNLVWRMDEAGRLSTFEYDGERRRLASVFAGERTTYAYDSHGNLAEVTTPEAQPGGRRAGRSRAYGYDALDRMVSVAEAGLVTSYAYDAVGNLTRTTDPRDRVVAMDYDALDRLIARRVSGVGGAGPELVTRMTSYDGEGALLSMEDARGQVFNFSVDELGRRTDSYAPSGTTDGIVHVHVDYDEVGNPTSAITTRSGPSGSTTDLVEASWDDFNRAAYVIDRGLRVDFGYDAGHHRTLIATGAGTTAFAYDERGRLTAATAGGETSTFAYETDGRIQSVTRPNGVETLYQWEPTNRLDEVVHRVASTGELIAAVEYDYDHDGNRVWEMQTSGARVESTLYQFDDLNRLDEVLLIDGEYRPSGSGTPPPGTLTRYTYDGYDRATETVLAGAVPVESRIYTQDTYGRLTTIAESGTSGSRTLTYEYDANGNLVSRADSSDPAASFYYEYDVWDRMVAVRRASALAPPTLTYEYDSGGMRIRERGGVAGDVDAWWLDGSRLEERRPGVGGSLGSLVARHHVGAMGLLRSDHAATGEEYFHSDAAGTTLALTSSTGTTAARYAVDAWGEVRSAGGASPNRQIFTGHTHDAETGLIYAGARYYDPDVGLFQSVDAATGTLDVPASQHAYLYAYANPTVFGDPDGNTASELVSQTSYSFGATQPAGGAVELGKANEEEFVAQHTGRTRNFFDALEEPVSRTYTIVGLAFAVTGLARVGMAAVGGAVRAGRALSTSIREAGGIARWAVAITEHLVRRGGAVARGLARGARGLFGAGRAGAAVERGATQAATRALSEGAPVITAELRAGQHAVGTQAMSAGRAFESSVESAVALERQAVRGEGAAARALGRAESRTAAGVAEEALGAESAAIRSADEAAQSAGSACRGGRCQRPGGTCFPGSTPVRLGASAVAPIESVAVGARVEVPDGTSCSHEERQAVHVQLVVPNGDHPGDVFVLDLLESAPEADELGHEFGALVWVEHEELDVRGWARVSVREDQLVEAGAGCVVSSTVVHENGRLVRVRFQDAEPLVATDWHRIYSATRSDFVPADSLWPGERVSTADGDVEVVWVEDVPGVHLVYNLEVEGVHQFYAGESAVLVHNGCDIDDVADPIGHGPMGSGQQIGGGLTDDVAEAWAEGSRSGHADFHGPWRPDPGPDGPPGYSSWGHYLESSGAGPIPRGSMRSPHAHHSVQRHGSGAQQELLERAHRIFRQRGGINAHYDLDNLAWNSLGGGNHSTAVVRDQLRRLELLDAMGGRPEDFRQLLRTFTEEASARTALLGL